MFAILFQVRPASSPKLPPSKTLFWLGKREAITGTAPFPTGAVLWPSGSNLSLPTAPSCPGRRVYQGQRSLSPFSFCLNKRKMVTRQTTCHHFSAIFAPDKTAATPFSTLLSPLQSGNLCPASQFEWAVPTTSNGPSRPLLRCTHRRKIRFAAPVGRPAAQKVRRPQHKSANSAPLLVDFSPLCGPVSPANAPFAKSLGVKRRFC